MPFFTQMPLTSLIELCRALRHYLGAGLTLRDAFRHLTKKGAPPVRALADRVVGQLETGTALEDALKPEQHRLPPLFLSLASVGEQTGNLPEVFRELERYFLLQKKLRSQFIAQSIWPVLQFFAAIFVIAGMIFLIGFLTPIGHKPFDPLGLGLTGETGAAIFLFGALGTVALLVTAFVVATRTLRGKNFVDRFLLRVPAVGPCLRALALARFCLALRLTLESGMSVLKAVRLSFRATGNAAFVDAADPVIDHVRRGEDLTVSLAACGLLPADFVHILEVGEESGRLTEVLDHQADHYQEEAGRRMTALTWVAGGLVWLLVAVLIIIVIFRIALTYIGMLDPANYGL